MIEFTKTGRSYTTGQETTLLKILEKMKWEHFTEGKEIALMPGMAIEEIRYSYRVPSNWYAISYDLAPYGLIGVQFEYRNSSVRSYWIDTGVECICIATDATPKEV